MSLVLTNSSTGSFSLELECKSISTYGGSAGAVMRLWAPWQEGRAYGSISIGRVVVIELGEGNGSRDIVGLGGGTRKLQDQADLVNGNDFSLALTDINVTIRADDLADLGSGSVALDRGADQLLLEPGAGPIKSVLADPVPVVGVMQGHLDKLRRGRIGKARQSVGRRQTRSAVFVSTGGLHKTWWGDAQDQRKVIDQSIVVINGGSTSHPMTGASWGIIT